MKTSPRRIITVDELNRQISEFATSHGAELAQAGMETDLLFRVVSILRSAQDRRKRFYSCDVPGAQKGQSMAEIIRGLKAYPKGIPQFEQAWVPGYRQSKVNSPTM